jgi:uncharacterized phage protein (TIGR01671 family)
MRPLEFRAWDKNDLEMINEFDSKYDWEYKDSGDFILMQFTGLLDKNGTKIFEGDIMKFEHDDIVSVVNYDINRACYIFKGWIDEYGNDTTLDSCYRLLEMASVIGNIFESPELIK